MSIVTKKNTNCIGTSHDGQFIILYTNNCYGIFSTNDLLIKSYIPNTGGITNPTRAFIDPHNNYLIVTSQSKTLFTSWECFDISSKKRLWYKRGTYTLYNPIWYSKTKLYETSSMCIQNNDFYGVNLEDGIDLKTGGKGTLSYRIGNSSSTEISNCSQGLNPTQHLASTGRYIRGKYIKIEGVYKKDTNEIEFNCDLGYGKIPLVDTELMDDFLPIKIIKKIKDENSLIIVQKNNVLHKLTLQNKKKNEFIVHHTSLD